MPERIAKSLARLRAQINERWPDRDKRSDGWLGDAAHRNRKSDHNPDPNGIVNALDITHDPVGGPDARVLAENIRKSRDRRIKYIISAGRIASERDDWAWRNYTGSNRHDRHTHFSVEAEYADDDEDWAIGGKSAAETVLTTTAQPTLKLGAKGTAVADLQEALNKAGASLKVDGDFGPATDSALRAFQATHGLKADRIAGPKTWTALGEVSKRVT